MSPRGQMRQSRAGVWAPRLVYFLSLLERVLNAHRLCILRACALLFKVLGCRVMNGIESEVPALTERLVFKRSRDRCAE